MCLQDSWTETGRSKFESFCVHPKKWRQVDKSGSVAEKRTPEIPGGTGGRPAEAVSWAIRSACRLALDVARTGAHVRPRGAVTTGR
jgi:hypothetical protein